MTKKNLILSILIPLILLVIIFLYFQSNSKINNNIIDPIVTPGKIINEPVKIIKEKENNFLKFDEINNLKTGGVANFSDGLVVTLKEINDSRCPVNVQCIWAGELRATLILSGNSIISPKEISIGTVNNKSAIFENYTFTLENADKNSINFIVSYKKTIPINGPCYVGGCSSQICSDQKDIMSTCEYSESYACYKSAKCERQINGLCSWTETNTLKSCLLNK